MGTSSGITFFISPQARYQHFDNGCAAIILIGIMGFGSDVILGLLGQLLFPWNQLKRADKN